MFHRTLLAYNRDNIYHLAFATSIASPQEFDNKSKEMKFHAFILLHFLASKIFYPDFKSQKSTFRSPSPFLKSISGQKCLSYLGPKLWNSIPSDLKLANNPDTFKHKIKETFSKMYKKGTCYIRLLLRPSIISPNHVWPYKPYCTEKICSIILFSYILYSKLLYQHF